MEAGRRHPLARALRIDKLSLAALEATLSLYRDPERALREIPVLRAAREPAADVRARPSGWRHASVGRWSRPSGGSVEERSPWPSSRRSEPRFPEIPRQCALAFRLAEVAVVGRIVDGSLVLDCRTLSDAEADRIAPP